MAPESDFAERTRCPCACQQPENLSKLTNSARCERPSDAFTRSENPTGTRGHYNNNIAGLKRRVYTSYKIRGYDICILS